MMKRTYFSYLDGNGLWIGLLFLLVLTVSCNNISVINETGVENKAGIRIGETTAAAVIDYVRRQAYASRLPGVSLGIAQGDRIMLIETFGNVHPDTAFFLASLSKSFTALAIMQLVDSGKISLDDPVIRYIPWLKIGDGTESRHITVRQLLNQTSGISTKAGLSSLRFKPDTDLKQSIQIFQKYPLTAKPGQRFEYSNANYMIAGYIIELVSGQLYADYIQHHIFDMLEMSNSRALSGSAEVPRLTPGYLNYFGFKAPYNNAGQMPSAVVPSGAIISTASDMMHYLIAQMNSGVYHDRRIVSTESLSKMHTPAVQVSVDAAVPDASAYGMGWGIGTLNGTDIVSHDGQLNNFQNNMAILPQKKIAVVMLINEYSPLLNEGKTYEGMMQGITTGIFPPISYSFFKYYVVFDIIVIVTLLLMIYSFYRFRKWSFRFESRVKEKGFWRVSFITIAFDLLVAVVIAFGVTYGLGIIFHIVPFTPALLMGSVPDMSLWFFVIIGFFLFRGITKACFVVSYYKNSTLR